jgi:hypothetical protein
MTNLLRLTIAAGAFAALAGCSGRRDQPKLSDDLKQDLATAGATNVQLAGATGQRLEVVSAAERTDGAVAAPKAPKTSRAPRSSKGTSAPIHDAKKDTPAAAQPAPQAPAAAPVEAPRAEPVPEPVPSQSRPQAPLPSTQREPPGGWKTPGQVIRNAPFPINP